MRNYLKYFSIIGFLMMAIGVVLWSNDSQYMPLAILLLAYGLFVADIFFTIYLDYIEYPSRFGMECVFVVVGIIVLIIYAITDFSGFVSTFFPSVYSS